ncbi:MAG: PQQ-binding-like beta-propeller repeat protein [Theionarchaea archaeon]|nr:PQQ-binding-like beta-propeller repeat protein [Theionarchaea archaeon]
MKMQIKIKIKMKLYIFLLLVACIYLLYPVGSFQDQGPSTTRSQPVLHSHLQSQSSLPTLAWVSKHGNYPFNEYSPMVDNGLVCTSTNKGLGLINIATGEEIWIEEVMTTMVPAMDCEHLYYVDKMLWGGYSSLNCYSTRENTLRWTQRIPGRPTFLPVITDEKMVLTTGAYSEIVGREPENENCIICINKYTGKRLWKFEGQGRMNSAPLVKNGIIYASTDDGVLYAVDLESGNAVWEFETGSPIYISKTPVIYQEKIYYVCDSLYCLDVSGELLWKREMNFNQKIFASKERLYTIEGDDVVSMDADSGEILWRFPTENFNFTTSIAGWEYLFYGCDDVVYCLSRDGELLWEYTISEHDDFFIHSSPILSEGYVVMGTRLGHVYTFRLPGEWCYQEAEAMYRDGDYDTARGFYEQALSYYEEKGDITHLDSITQRLSELGPEPDDCTEWSNSTMQSSNLPYIFVGICVVLLIGVIIWRKMSRKG